MARKAEPEIVEETVEEAELVAYVVKVVDAVSESTFFVDAENDRDAEDLARDTHRAVSDAEIRTVIVRQASAEELESGQAVVS